jgi:hypothetical protein
MDLVTLYFSEVFVYTNKIIAYHSQEVHRMNFNLRENLKTHKELSTEYSASIPSFTSFLDVNET